MLSLNDYNVCRILKFPSVHQKAGKKLDGLDFISFFTFRRKAFNHVLELESVKEVLSAIALSHPSITITVRNESTGKGTFINDVPRFLAISYLPTYPVILYNVPFLGLSWTPLPTLIWDAINERSLI